MLKKSLSGIIFALILAVGVMPVHQAAAQSVRSIVPYDRDVTIETVDPRTQTPRNAFCIGMNTIDVKLTNNSDQRKYVAVINRDTEGEERTLYYGWLEPGSHSLSELMRMQFNLPGPAGMETLRVMVNEYGQMIPGNAVSFYVRECGGGYYPPYGGGGGYGYYTRIQAHVYPFAIEQGKKGTVLLQTNITSQSNAAYYFEILNSWGQLWKRIPVSKPPYQRYRVTLPVGENTKPGRLTYTVKLWYEPGSEGSRRTIATTKFSFRVIPAGTGSTPYYPGYPGYPGYSGNQPYPAYPSYPGGSTYGTVPYSGMPSYGMAPATGMPSYSGSPYPSAMDPYSGMGYPGAMTPYSGYPMGSATERDIR